MPLQFLSPLRKVSLWCRISAFLEIEKVLRGEIIKVSAKVQLCVPFDWSVIALTKTFLSENCLRQKRIW